MKAQEINDILDDARFKAKAQEMKDQKAILDRILLKKPRGFNKWLWLG